MPLISPDGRFVLLADKNLASLTDGTAVVARDGALGRVRLSDGAVIRTISGKDLSGKAGSSRPHTMHCGPDGVFLTCIGGPEGDVYPGVSCEGAPENGISTNFTAFGSPPWKVPLSIWVRVNPKVSSASSRESPVTGTATDFWVSPGPNTTVPDVAV